MTLAALLTLCIVSFPGYSQSWEEHGPLRVSSNRRYIEHTDRTPFLWLGDTAWNLAARLTREEIDLYLDDRRAKGITVIQAVLHFTRSPGPGLGVDERNPRNVYGHRIFAGSATDPETSIPLEQPGVNNDYWDHVDYFVLAARKRGLHIGLVPFWGSNFVDGANPNARQYTAGEARAYGGFLGKRFRREPHVIWIPGADTIPGRNGEALSIYRALAEGIVEGVSGKSAAWNRPSSAWDRVLLTFHPAAFSSSGFWFGAEDRWIDFNMAQTGQFNPETVFDLIHSEYNRTAPVRPIVNGESAYEAWTVERGGFFKSPLDVRRGIYQTFQAGGAGYTYGHEASAKGGADHIWAFGVESGGKSWKDLLNSAGIRQLAIAGKFYTRHRWWTLIPDQTLIAAGHGRGVTRKCALRSADSKTALVYFPERTPAEVKFTQGARLSWFDPRDGSTLPVSAADLPKSEFLPPSGWEDGVLVIEPGLSSASGKETTR